MDGATYAERILTEARRLEKQAEQYCRRAMHAQAADLFMCAAAEWLKLDQTYRAGYCAGQEAAERRQMRPTMPVNRAALVD